MVDTSALLGLGQLVGVPVWLLVIVFVWSLFWKAIALWKSARLNQPIWFVILLLVNTFGVLEILYIFLISKIDFSKKNTQRKNTRRKK